MISPLNTRTAFTYEDHQPGYYRISSPDILQAQFMAEYAYHELGVRYVAVYLEDNTFGRIMADGFVKRFENLGGKILTRSVAPPFDTYVYYELTNQLRGEGVEAIYMALTAENAATFTVYMREFGMDVPLLASDAIDTVTFYDNASSSAYNVFFTESRPSPFQSPYAYGYDSTRLLLEAIARVAVQDANGILHIGRQALRNILFKVSFDGQTGTIECYDNGDCGHVPMMIYIIKEGQPQEIHQYLP